MIIYLFGSKIIEPNILILVYCNYYEEMILKRWLS